MTFAFVASLIRVDGVSFRTNDTVDRDTPAARATSALVMWFLEFCSCAMTGASSQSFGLERTPSRRDLPGELMSEGSPEGALMVGGEGGGDPGTVRTQGED